MATLSPPAELPAPVLVHALAGDEAERCPSCAAPLAGDYCHVCGERRFEDERLSLRHFFGELWDEIFDLDSRALRSLRLLVARPGFLTLENLQGRRRPYIGALKLYLVVFAVTLFTATLIPDNSTSGRKDDALTRQFLRVVHWLAMKRGASDAAMRRSLEQVAAQHVSWLSLLIPLLFAAFLFALFHRRRRWFGEHLLFATHFATLNFLVGLSILPLQLAAARRAPQLTVWLSVLALVPLCTWAVLAVRRVYHTGWPGAVGSALALFVALGIAQLVTGLLAMFTAALQILWWG